MPRRKKIRTTSTERRASGDWDPPAVRKLANIRREVAVEAARIMEEYKVHSLLVVDAEQRVVGALNIHDLLDARVI